ncbi:molecular chaperone [Pseudomonas sp. MH9.2]|uniref:fimbrial biogenesis chaperone n=1 Tax=unclassified Pseudomonas TaxID=196821 RepID=UPI002AC980B2|nr:MULTISPECIES: molecular chaperone [unclassified Pseudomonas]MEB0024424.1 molecular chaperone [Pseudomonas sp. MH9.2]MEB0150304.1 molecular chaperone [Pseudomonas sp. CCC2.2]WPX68122.1 molecular chaperone [Pseudomonas sp. MH9.2]
MSLSKRLGQRLISLILLLMGIASASVQAAVSLTGTRLIFDGAFREVSIEVINRSPREVLLQAWLSSAANEGDGVPDDLPFALTPHLSQLPVNGKQALRILYEGVGMPQGRESLLHLYVMEIPRRAEGENPLSIAIRQRINVFYRPPGLPGDPADSAQELLWQLTRDANGRMSLQVSNRSAFHASLQDLQLEGRAGKHDVSDYLLLLPGTTRILPLSAAEPADSQWQYMSFKALTDYGGQRSYRAEIDGRLPFKARLLPGITHLKGLQP